MRRYSFQVRLLDLLQPRSVLDPSHSEILLPSNARTDQKLQRKGPRTNISLELDNYAIDGSRFAVLFGLLRDL